MVITVGNYMYFGLSQIDIQHIMLGFLVDGHTLMFLCIGEYSVTSYLCNI